MLSMLQQIINDDKADGVRQAAAKSLAVLVAFIDDKAKFQNVCNCIQRNLNPLGHSVVVYKYEKSISAKLCINNLKTLVYKSVSNYPNKTVITLIEQSIP